MSLDNIIQQLKAERARIDKALAALGEPSEKSAISAAVSFPTHTPAPATTTHKATKKGKGRKPLTPEAKARIVAAQKARWAAYHAKHPKKK